MRNSNGLAGFGFRSWTGGSASSCASWDSAVSTYVPRASSFPRNSWKRFLGTHPSTTKLWSLTANRTGASALSTSTSRTSSAETTKSAYFSRSVSRRTSSIRRSRSLIRAVAFFRASSSSVMFSSSVRIFSRSSSIRTSSEVFGGAFSARMFAIDRSLTRFSESSAAGGSGLPIRNVSSSPWRSTMWMSFISCKVSMTAASFSRGPATTARAIGSGLSTHRTPELFQDQLHRTIDVPAAATRHPSGLLAGLGEQPLPFLRDGPLGRGEDLSVSVLAFLAGLVDQVERLATGGAQHLFAFALRGLLHRPNLGLRFLDSLERFRFTHIGMGRRTGFLLKGFRSSDTTFAREGPRAPETFSCPEFYTLAIMLLGRPFERFRTSQFHAISREKNAQLHNV